MFETAILILLYNKEISASSTINSLINSNVQYPNAKLVIWNNGPQTLKKHHCRPLQNLGYDLAIKETLNNESLAIIYNQFIADNKALKYILLDDDSAVNESYISASLECQSSDIGMPLITAQGKVRTPRLNHRPCSLGMEFNSQDNVITIGSGLIIGSQIVTTITRAYTDFFDERFYLYGVDSTFCLRLIESNLVNNIKIIPGFEHTLSRLEKEDIKTVKFRRIERGYDRGLRLRYYSSFPSALLYIIRNVAKTLRRVALNKPYTVDMFSLLKAYISGKHYRANKCKKTLS